ncbi:Wzz/FepE/Etk N-terminal domain-containing protein [Thioalkalivibrio sp. XN8]|uniref:Wzz/FepE/Etk N-terminal domain-containing protein n=1 Tax=Thioalkalivibrio sp. XN8 TaxID=2712863 RepID=UPI0013EC3E64|nr:Wzz/FepE/Etk N-terminal domain-containing protein [Thioalkalivibrio sp. XN8]NGP53791.1 hypothetical protein [Thioalkalivibrio sp. XN8]
MVYVVPDPRFDGSTDDEIDLRELLRILWDGKQIIAATTMVFAVAAIAYAFLATEWFRTATLLAPAEEVTTPAIGGQLGGLAALAGVSIGGEGSAEAIAVLRSRELARAFVEDFGLLKLFFQDEWDATRKAWRDDDPEDWPDTRDAVDYFHDHVLSVSEDRDSGLVTLAIEWTDPEVAAQWAAELVVRLNNGLRERALAEAETNVAFLRAELAQTSLVTLQQSIGRLLESELQKLMLARGNEEFAFRVIDPAWIPREHVRPNRPVLAIAGVILGAMVGVLLVFLLHVVRSNPD